MDKFVQNDKGALDIFLTCIQQEYSETRAGCAVVTGTTKRCYWAFLAVNNVVIHQMASKAAFLNGDLQSVTFPEQQKGAIGVD